MQSELNSQDLAGGCSKNLENLFWTCTETKKKGTKGFKKKIPGLCSLMIVRVCLLLFERVDLTMIQKLLSQVIVSCCLPGISSFSFASSKACPDCWRTLKKEGLLHTLWQSLCHHPNRQRHLLQLWQAVGPCWQTSWIGQLACCSSSVALEWQCWCLGEKLLQGCSTIPTQQWWGARMKVLSWTMERDGVKPVTCIWLTWKAGRSSREHRQRGRGYRRRKSLHCSDGASLCWHKGFVPPPRGLWYSQSVAAV